MRGHNVKEQARKICELLLADEGVYREFVKMHREHLDEGTSKN